jgi:carboxyl-terminal processing protease
MNEMRDITPTQVIHDVPEVRPRSGASLLGIGLAVLLSSAAFFSGIQIGGNTRLEASISSFFATNVRPDEEVDLTEFWQVWNLLDEKFVSSSTTDPHANSNEERLYGAISGLVNSFGDPYTVFLPPEDATRFEDDIAGNFSGVGMEVGIRDGAVTVIAPLPETPAEKAGILPGDVILRIDEKSTDGMGIDEAVDLIRGEKGTNVKLTLYREGEEEFLDKMVTRDTISIPTAATEVKDDVFIIKLYSFNALSEAEMEKALREYVKSGKKKMIVDLRGNPGGFLQSAVTIASYFLPTGKVVVRESFGGDQAEQIYRSSGKTLKNFAPQRIVVLVDGGSASASEILAGALQEHGVVKLIGSQTFGKGSVQELVSLKDNSSLKVTIARWLTPNGISISANGLTPDIVVERTPQQYIAGEDPQMDKALEFLGGNE